MKLTYRLMVFAIAAALLAACSPTTATPTPTNTVAPIIQEGTGYPTIPTLDPAYPAGAPINGALPTPDMSQFAATPDVALSPVIISEVTQANGLETMVVKNISDQTQDVSRWIMWQPDEDARYFLPDSLTLEPGQTFEVFNGATQGKPEDRVWTDHMMLNVRDDYIVLLNHAGRIIYYYVVR